MSLLTFFYFCLLSFFPVSLSSWFAKHLSPFFFFTSQCPASQFLEKRPLFLESSQSRPLFV